MTLIGEFRKEFGNPNRVDSSSQFNPKYAGVLFQSLEQWWLSKMKEEKKRIVKEVLDKIKISRDERADRGAENMTWNGAVVCLESLKDKIKEEYGL